MVSSTKHKTRSHTSIATWLVTVLILLFSISSFAQDKQPINNKGKIKQIRAKSVKKKEKGSTKDIAGRRLRTKNANSVAGRAVYSNPSPYANERRGKDRASKPIGGQPLRIRSRSAESARNNVYPQRGPFVNRESKRTEGQSNRNRFTRSGNLSTKRTSTSGGSVNPPRSRTRSAESSRANAYPQRGPFVNRSSRQTERPAAKIRTRTGKLSTSARLSNTVRLNTPRSRSASAETSRSSRFQQRGPFVNRSSKNTQSVSSSSNRFTRKGKLSAGPTPPGKKRTVTPRSASQQFVTRGRKDVYWGKFSKGEKAITTDVSGNPLRRRNYRTPPNEIIQPKNPYADRKKSSGDRAYSGTFKSGHVSRSKRTENAWKGDLAGQSLRKRSDRQNQVAGQKIGTPKMFGGLSAKIQRTFDNRKGVRPEKGGGGSVSGKLRSNAPLTGRPPGIGASAMMRGQNRITGIRPQKGGGGSISGKLRSNSPISGRPPGIGASAMLRGQNRITGMRPQKGGGGSISAAGKYRSNQSFNGRNGPLSITGKNRAYEVNTRSGGSISATGKYRSNQPLSARQAPLSISNKNRVYEVRSRGGGSISATGKYRSNEAFNGRKAPLSISNKNRVYEFKSRGGGSISATGKYRSNEAFNGRQRPLSITGQNKKYDHKAPAIRSMSGLLWNNNNQPINVRTPGVGGSALARYERRINTRQPTKVFSQGGLNYYKENGAERSRKGPLKSTEKSWNNNGQPIQVRTPLSGEARKAEDLQVGVKSKKTGTKPNAVKGSMPGLAPTKATVKASEYSRSMKVYWSYKHNPSSADEAQKTIAPSKSFTRASSYAGRTRLTKNYRHNPMSDKDALKVIAPGRAYARITDYQGNIKMGKYNDKRFLPDSKFAHGRQNNVKQERTMMTDFKLLWTKIFKKNGTQPDAVKEKSVRPRYDKRERELWPGLYD